MRCALCVVGCEWWAVRCSIELGPMAIDGLKDADTFFFFLSSCC